MAENEKISPPTAKEPVFNINVDPNISWVVNDESDETPEIDSEIKESVDHGEQDSSEEEHGHDYEVEEQEEEEEKPRRKNKKTSQRRIAELNYKLKTAEQIAYKLAAEKEELEKKLIQQEKMTLGQYENLLKTNKETIKQAMIQAHEEGDSQRYAHAADLLSQYNAELKDVEEKKKQARFESRNDYIPEEVFQTEPEDDDDPEYYSYAEEWVRKNPWANPKSRSFNERMFKEADDFSAKLMGKYQLEGRDDEIGTPEFFAEIEEYMKETYNVSKPSSSANKMKAPSHHVAPVNRTPTSNYKKPHQNITLSPDEKAIAHQLRGLIRDKNGNYITDNKTLEQIYIQNRGRS